MRIAHMVDDKVAAIFEREDIVIGRERIGWNTAQLWAANSASDLSRRNLVVITQADPPTADVVEEDPCEVGDSEAVDGWTSRAFTTQELARYRASQKEVVKELARLEIETHAKEWKQRNTIARGLELVIKVMDGETLTSGEQAEVTTGQALWAGIKDVRAHSDTVETAIDAAGSRAAIDAIVSGISWPT